MTDASLDCPDCSAPYGASDNYCRQCGMFVAALRAGPAMPLVKSVPVAPVLVERQRAPLPAPVKKAVTALAIGTALQIGASVAGKYLVRSAASQAAKQAGNAFRGRPAARGEGRTGATTETTTPATEAAAVSETVLIHRVWIRRG